MYVDVVEVQICNPIGSYNHKLFFFYFSIANLPRHLRSKFEMMHLFSVFYDHHVKRYGYNILLKPIVEDLKKLEAGVKMCIKGNEEIIRGTLTALVADNLATHLVFGMKSSFGPLEFRKCRFCQATEDEIQTLFSYIHFIRRTKSHHQEYCDALLHAAIAEHVSLVYGVNFNSVLNELTYFHVTSGCPPDVMYDLLEGIVPRVMSQLLKHCVRKYFSLSELNSIIRNFNYGYV